MGCRGVHQGLWAGAPFPRAGPSRARRAEFREADSWSDIVAVAFDGIARLLVAHVLSCQHVDARRRVCVPWLSRVIHASVARVAAASWSWYAVGYEGGSAGVVLDENSRWVLVKGATHCAIVWTSNSLCVRIMIERRQIASTL